jgi:hypothetical protein
MKFFLITMLVFVSLLLVNADQKKPDEKQTPQEEVVLDFSKYKFTTNKGTEVKVKDLVCGILRKMGKGERFINGYTSSNKPIYAQKWHREPAVWGNEVPVIEGYIFGAFIVLDAFPEGEYVEVEIIDTPPFEYEIDGKKLKQIKTSYNLKKHHKNYPLITTFKNEAPQFMQLGNWKKEFYNNGKLIFSYNYKLVKASEEELQKNAVYEEYVKEAQKSLIPPEDKKEEKKAEKKVKE